MGDRPLAAGDWDFYGFYKSYISDINAETIKCQLSKLLWRLLMLDLFPDISEDFKSIFAFN